MPSIAASLRIDWCESTLWLRHYAKGQMFILNYSESMYRPGKQYAGYFLSTFCAPSIVGEIVWIIWQSESRVRGGIMDRARILIA